MPILPIFEYPAAILTRRADAISVEELQSTREPLSALVDMMFETMYAAPGVGLAAPQVGVSRRLFTMDCGAKGTGKYVFINPVIIEASGEQLCEEGCLSFPGIFEKVKRYERLTLSYLDLASVEQLKEFSGFEAVCVQHEREHLDGILFTSHLSRLKQDRVKQKLAKRRR